MKPSIYALLVMTCTPLWGTATAAETRTAQVSLNIEAQPIEDALNQFAQQSGLQILISSQDAPKGVRSPKLVGKYEPAAALAALLKGTGLVAYPVNENTYGIRTADSKAPAGAATAETGANISRAGPDLRVVQSETAAMQKVENAQSRKSAGAASSSESPSDDAESSSSKGIPEILVRDSRILNMDIRRTRDDAQPYVIFEREAIERSGANSLEEFFKYRLTSNTRNSSASQTADFRGNASQINLRGFGTTETLILVDGRRIADMNLLGTTGQPDINGIPLAAIERIEVLPTTASGIYGAGAAGGVINIVMRRDYRGTEVKATYDNTFDTDSAIRRADLSSGFSLEGGRSNILLSASYSDANVLTSGDRNFLQRGRNRVLANNPEAFMPPIVPLGRTANIRSVAPLQLKEEYGNTMLDSTFTHAPVGYAGLAADGAGALVANAGTYNLGLAGSRQSPGGVGRALAFDPVVQSANLTLRREFAPNLQAFVDGSISENLGTYNRSGVQLTFTVPSSSPTNPFRQTITVAVPVPAADFEQTSKTSLRRLGAGVILRLSPQWQLSANHGWSRSTHQYRAPPRLNPTTLRNAINSGALDLLRDPELHPLGLDQLEPYLQAGQTTSQFGSVQRNSSLRLGGSVGMLSGGRPSLTVLLDHRDQTLQSGLNTALGGLTPTYMPEQSYEVYSAYVETVLPLVSGMNKRPGLHMLELQLAGRHDRYDAVGATYVGTYPNGTLDRSLARTDSTNPTVGLRYQPAESIMLRASYGTGFRPPLGADLVPNDRLGAQITDPRRGETVILSPPGYKSGGNADLLPEESEGWSVGSVLTPGFIPGLRMSVDYSWIEKTNIISMHPGNQQGIVNDEDLFPERVIRGAPDALNSQYGPIIGLDATLMNLSLARAEAFDLAVDYGLSTARAGKFDFYAVATLQTHYITQLLSYTPEEEQAGTGNGPVKFRGNAGVTWNAGPWTLGWNVRYYHSYLVDPGSPEIHPAFDNILSQGGPAVPSQLYHDVFAEYRLSPAGVLSNAKVLLGIKNLFNMSPPFDASNGSDYYSYYGDPRLASYSLSITAGF